MRASRLGLLVLLLHASVGLAQVQVIVVNVNGNMNSPSGSFTYQLLKNTCEIPTTTIPINWAAQTNDLLFWTFDSSCGVSSGVIDGGMMNTIETTSNPSPVTGGIQKSASIYPTKIMNQIVNPDIGVDACTQQPPAVGTAYICVTQTVTNGFGSQVTLSWYMTLNYNMNPPPPPYGVDLVPGDQNLVVNFNYDSSSIAADHYIVYALPDETLVSDAEGVCTPGPDAGSAGPGATDPSTWPIQQNFGRSGLTLNNLVIGQCYDVVIQAIAFDGTQGLPSVPAAAAPIELLDYWRLYHLEGGQDPGGLHCQEAGGGLSIVATLAPLLWYRRRKRAPE